jgi:DNA-binding NarL/FixJ family response regulator
MRAGSPITHFCSEPNDVAWRGFAVVRAPRGIVERVIKSDTSSMAGGEPIEVVLVEDNDVFREALELMLEVTPDIKVVGAVADGEAALEVCPRLDPDVVLVDYRLPGLDGVETTAGLRYVCPEVAVVVLTASADTGEVQALLDAGAVACLTKDRGLEEIIGAIREAAGRGAAIG